MRLTADGRARRSVLRALVPVTVLAIAAACDSSPQGPKAAAPAAPRLFLAGDSELWVVDTATDRVRHLRVPELSPGDPPYRILRRGNRLVLWGGATYVRNRDLVEPAEPLAEDAGFFIPSAHPDRVWLGIFDPTSNAALAAVREVTVTGKVTVPDAKPPGGRWPDGAVTDGLLFSIGAGSELVWDPRSRKSLRRLPIADPGPSFGNLVTSCGFRCETLRLTDAHTGASRAVGVPAGFAAFEARSGAFSPDGSLLAVPIRSHRGGFALALVDVRLGVARMIRGAHVPAGYTLVAWSPSGNTVFLTGGDRFKKRLIVSYRMDETRARVLYARFGDFYGIAAA